MLSQSSKFALKKIVLIPFVLWAAFVFVVFLFSGSFKAAIPAAIIVAIITAKYFYQDFKDYKKDNRHLDDKEGSSN